MGVPSCRCELKTDPVILRASCRPQNQRRAPQISNPRLHPSVVEEIAHSQSTAYLRDLNCVSSQPAGVFESSVSLIDKEALRLKVSGCSVSTVHLRIHMSVDQEKILPAIIVEVDESVTPADIALRAPGNAGGDRRVGEVHSSIVYDCIVAIEGGVLVVKMRRHQRHTTGMQVVAEVY